MMEYKRPSRSILKSDQHGHYDAGQGNLKEPAFAATDMTASKIGVNNPENATIFEDAFLAAGGEGVAAAAQELINMPPGKKIINE